MTTTMTAPAPLSHKQLACHWPSVAWGEAEWRAALEDRDTYHAILRGIGQAYQRRQSQDVTPAELAALTLASQGCAVAEIAVRNYASADTIKTTLARARRKLGARNTTHAVSLALARDLIPLPRAAT